MKLNKSLLTLTLMLTAVAALSAWSITDTYFGNRTGTQDARGYSMGGTGLFDDLRPLGISANPANLTLMKKTLGLGGSLIVNRNEDNRHVPLYNSFDNYIDDSVYASNIHFYEDFSGAGFVSKEFGGLKVGLGAYYKPLLSFDGDYEEQIRNNRNTDNDGYPEKIAVNMIENEGLLNQASGVLSLGYDLGEYMDVSLGFDYALLFGDIESSKTIRWSQWAIDTVGEGILPDYTYSESTELDGSRFKAGATVRLNSHFGLAATFTNKATLDRTGDWKEESYSEDNPLYVVEEGSYDEDYILPMELRLGLNYQPRNIMHTWFNLEGEYVKFSEVPEFYEELETKTLTKYHPYEDIYNIYAGVEHHVKNRLPLRLGFQATGSYLRLVESDGAIIARKIITPMITGGSSIHLGHNLNLDLAFGYSWREYEALDLFGDSYYDDRQYTGENTYQLWPNQYIELEDRGWENPDKVRENNINLRTSLSFTW